MSGEAPARRLTSAERALAEAILRTSALSEAERDRLRHQLTTARWLPMSDGGMGSLERVVDDEVMPLSPDNRSHPVGEVVFADSDGTKVSATLVVDSHGELREMDVWKVDFTPVLRMPSQF